MSSSGDETKKSLPNLSTILTQPLASRVARSISKEDKINMTLDDIEESPSPSSTSHGEIELKKEEIKPQPQILKVKAFNLPRIEYTKEEEEAIGTPPITEKRDQPLKTPKSYFFESLQKRRSRAMTKSQSAARFLAAAGPNLIRRGSNSSSENNDFEDKFSNLDLVNNEITPINETSTKKSLWNPSGTKVASRYEVSKTEWSYNSGPKNPKYLRSKSYASFGSGKN